MPHDETESGHYVTCPSCGGSGQVGAEPDDCPSCYGSGRVPVDLMTAEYPLPYPVTYPRYQCTHCRAIFLSHAPLGDHLYIVHGLGAVP